jgi:YidC/Oxa1 family membrane protein insertase
MEARRLITALTAAMLVFLTYTLVYDWIRPERPPASGAQPVAGVGDTAGWTQPPGGDGQAPFDAGEVAAGAGQAAGAATGPSSAPTSRPPGGKLSFTSGPEVEPIRLGGPGQPLELLLDPRGASLGTLELAEQHGRKGREHYVYQTAPNSSAPYVLLKPIMRDGQPQNSFITRRLILGEHGAAAIPLENVVWNVAPPPEATAGQQATFTTLLRSADGATDVLALTKTYTLQPGKPVVDLSLSVRNLTQQPLQVTLEQDGPSGIAREGSYGDMIRLLTAHYSEGRVALGTARQRPDLVKATQAGGSVHLLAAGSDKLAWIALTNKFFGVFMRPLGAGDQPGQFVHAVEGVAAAPYATDVHGDLVARVQTVPLDVPAGGEASVAFEIYAGPKDAQVLDRVNPLYIDRTRLGYDAAQAADISCMCTFEPLPQIMGWLLRMVYAVVGNYGVAIIVLVLIVRGLLHPLAVWQQKAMYRTQEGMMRIQPKMEAIKERFANDRVRQNQEIMKLMSEERVNPAAGMVSMIPLFIQMPILVALWTELNSDIRLRHAPFDGWWIRDLAAPDAFLTFDPPFSVPLLSAIPLIGAAFSNIASLNLLPILMGLSMYLQQKYMPKPHMQAQLEAARKNPPAERKPGGGLSAEEQIRQQQMMANMMAILFPIMFYSMPSGLTLYWMATNIFGICESLIIRKQIERDKLRRAKEGPAPPKPAGRGLFARFMERMAERAEQIQRKADEMSQRPGAKRSK